MLRSNLPRLRTVYRLGAGRYAGGGVPPSAAAAASAGGATPPLPPRPGSFSLPLCRRPVIWYLCWCRARCCRCPRRGGWSGCRRGRWWRPGRPPPRGLGGGRIFGDRWWGGGPAAGTGADGSGRGGCGRYIMTGPGVGCDGGGSWSWGMGRRRRRGGRIGLERPSVAAAAVGGCVCRGGSGHSQLTAREAASRHSRVAAGAAVCLVRR
ncbi:hypothetical protein I4F81_012432 [Pyropia yezoensis]|uniref:Uncharacterized protein n=1 Tax=Pyropia yezoensis TaxID=2788 RepID=A0ACC3CJN4_PYRYE|nr:hypothetical protein I4F81_012432 [Neopyropia yezoensis]